MNPHDETTLDELFRAARREGPSAAAEQRVFSALEKELRADRTRFRSAGSPRRLALAAGLAAVAAALVVLLGSERAPEPALSFTPEALSAPQASRNQPPPSPALPPAPPAPSAAPVARPRRTPRPGSESPAIERKPPSLTEEIAALDRARGALASGDTERALGELDRHAESGGKRMSAEATLLRIEALMRADRSSEARALAERFASEHPTSPLLDRARRIAAESKDQGGIER